MKAGPQIHEKGMESTVPSETTTERLKREAAFGTWTNSNRRNRKQEWPSPSNASKKKTLRLANHAPIAKRPLRMEPKGTQQTDPLRMRAVGAAKSPRRAAFLHEITRTQRVPGWERRGSRKRWEEEGAHRRASIGGLRFGGVDLRRRSERFRAPLYPPPLLLLLLWVWEKRGWRCACAFAFALLASDKETVGKNNIIMEVMWWAPVGTPIAYRVWNTWDCDAVTSPMAPSLTAATALGPLSIVHE